MGSVEIFNSSVKPNIHLKVRKAGEGPCIVSALNKQTFNWLTSRDADWPLPSINSVWDHDCMGHSLAFIIWENKSFKGTMRQKCLCAHSVQKRITWPRKSHVTHEERESKYACSYPRCTGGQEATKPWGEASTCVFSEMNLAWSLPEFFSSAFCSEICS